MNEVIDPSSFVIGRILEATNKVAQLSRLPLTFYFSPHSPFVRDLDLSIR